MLVQACRTIPQVWLDDRVRTCHVTQIAGEAALWSGELIVPRIKGAVQGNGSLRAKFMLKPPQHWPAGEAEINVKTGNVLRLQVLSSARVQCSYRDRSINVVKSLNLCGGIKNFFNRGERVRKVGANKSNFTRGEIASHFRKDVIPSLINVDGAERRLWHISIGGIPLQVALKKNNTMTASAQGPGEGAIRGRVSVAPR